MGRIAELRRIAELLSRAAVNQRLEVPVVFPRIGRLARRPCSSPAPETEVRMIQPQNDAATRWLSAALAEYQSLRTESLQAQHAQQTILQFGITGVAVLVGLSLQLENEGLAILLLLLMVPLVSIFIVSVWFTEIFRSLRAGNFLAEREEKINKEIGNTVPALEWETWLRVPAPERRMFNRTRMSFGVLCTLNVAGFILAGYLARTGDFTLPLAMVIALGLVSLALLTVSIVVYRRYERRFYEQSPLGKAAARTTSSTSEEVAGDGM
jgi:hypothetical protein